MKRVGVAIIGAGPRGLAVLERMSALLAPSGLCEFDVHVVDPGRPGQGIHRDTQPDHLLTNTAAASTTVFVDASVTDAGPARPGPNLREWLALSGDKFKDECLVRVGADGDAVDGDLFVPRAILGQYLNWAYRQIVGRMPSNVTVRHHANRAVAILKRRRGGFAIALDSGRRLDVDFVFLTTGHGGSGPSAEEARLEQCVGALQERNPHLNYLRTLDPIERLDEIGSAARVAICGLGLTALDAVSMFTHGRGGTFSKVGAQRLRYRPSGQEPRLTLFSRQGLPSVSKAVDQKTPGRAYRPKIFTPDFVERLRCRRSKLDWDRDLLPHLAAEMALCLANSEQGHASDAEPAPEHVQAIDLLLHPWKGAAIADAQAHAAFVRRHLEADIAAAFVGNVDHPLKAVAEMVRDLNDVVRLAVDYGGLTGDSHARFLRDWCSIANRIAAGPPKERSMELLALIEAGVVAVFEPSPTVVLDEDAARFEVVSNAFGYEHRETFDVLIQARVGLVQPQSTTDPLLRSGLDRGLFSAFDNDGFAPSGISIDENLNVVGADGRSMPNFWAMGYVVEGAHYYTYVLPCPSANSRSQRDAGKAVIAMIGQAETRIEAIDCPTDASEMAQLAN